MPPKSVYPAHSQDLDDDEDDKLVVRSDRTAVSEDEDDKSLVQPALRSDTVKSEFCCNTQSPYTVTKKKRTSSLARLEQDVSGASRERSGEVSSVGKKNRP